MRWCGWRGMLSLSTKWQEQADTQGEAGSVRGTGDKVSTLRGPAIHKLLVCLHWVIIFKDQTVWCSEDQKPGLLALPIRAAQTSFTRSLAFHNCHWSFLSGKWQFQGWMHLSWSLTDFLYQVAGFSEIKPQAKGYSKINQRTSPVVQRLTLWTPNAGNATKAWCSQKKKKKNSMLKIFFR